MSVKGMSIPNAMLLGQVAALLREGKEVVFAPKGQSMIPFLVEGRDSVRLQKTDTVAVGDIVLACLPDGRYVLHRVLICEGDALTLMGDGNLQLREKCRTDAVCGTVTAFLRADGTELDPRSASSLRQARLWRKLLPLRRFLLWIYRRTPAGRGS